jgi:hypothetical protein
MSDNATIESATPPKEKKRRGRGSGKPPPTVVFDGAIVLPEGPQKKHAVREYSEEMTARICDWVAEGRSLRSFCAQEGTPTTITVWQWQEAHPDFDRRYARAKLKGMDDLAEWAVDELSNPDLPPEQVQRAKYEFEARKWYVSKIAPLRYGDKIQAELSGPGGAPLQLDIMLQTQLNKPEVLARLSEAQIEALLTAIPLLTAPAAGSSEAVVDAEFTEVEKEKDK